MDIDYDTSTIIGSWSSSATTTGSHTCTGTDRYLHVAVFTNAAVTAMTASYNSVSMTQLSVVVDTDGNKNFVFYLANPASGSNTVSVTRTGGSNMSIVAASYTGVDQTDPVEDSSTDTGVSSPAFTSTAVTTTADNWLIGTFRDTDSRANASAELTRRVTTGVVPEELWDSAGTVSTGSNTVSYTISPSGRLQGHTLVAIKPAAAAATDVKNSSLATNLVSYWELEEASGTRVDSHGANDLTASGSPSNATAIQGDGVDLVAGSSQYLAGSAISSLTTNFSASFWMKPDSVAGYDGIYMSGTTSNFWRLGISSGTPKFTFTENDVADYKGGTTLSTGTWYHCVITKEGIGTNNLKIYLNGTLDGTHSVGSTTTPSGDTTFGAYNLTGSRSLFFDGIIDEFAVWSRALSAADVTSLYNSGAGLPYEAPATPTTFSLTVNASKVAATLTDYPAYVDLADMPASFWAEVTNGGGDIRVYSDSGLTTELAREVVSCDTAVDTGEMHVKVPSLTTSSVIYVTVDGTSTEPAAGATYGSQAVWSDYILVVHGDDATTSTVTDSANGVTINKLSANNPAEATGKIGQAQYNDNAGTPGDWMNVTNTTYNAWGNGDGTVQAWYKEPASGTRVTGSLIDKRAGSSRPLALNLSSGKAQAYIYDGSNFPFITGTVDVQDGGWHMLHAVSQQQTQLM
jgi:hypothetical protein